MGNEGASGAADLPIEEVLDDVVAATRERGVSVLVAPPGAGKTTRVPPALLRAGLGPVVVLEPRRIAARAAARRVAEENGWTLGGEVGYHVRFDRKAGRDTRVLFCTEGILLARLQEDPFLEGVGCIVFDEFHERSLHADLALAADRGLLRTLPPPPPDPCPLPSPGSGPLPLDPCPLPSSPLLLPQPVATIESTAKTASEFSLMCVSRSLASETARANPHAADHARY